MVASTKAQAAQWSRLKNLYNARRDLEIRILASMRQLETNCLNLSRELNAVFVGRLDDINGTIATTKVLADALEGLKGQ